MRKVEDSNNGLTVETLKPYYFKWNTIFSHIRYRQPESLIHEKSYCIPAYVAVGKYRNDVLGMTLYVIWHWGSSPGVAYWLRPSCQNRKCICVNNGCIRSRNISAICDAYKKVDVELLYNSVHWKFNQLVIRCGKEDQHPAEGALRTPDWAVAVGEKVLESGTCPRGAGSPNPRLSSPGRRERNAVMAIRVGVNLLQFCSVSNSLSQ